MNTQTRLKHARYAEKWRVVLSSLEEAHQDVTQKLLACIALEMEAEALPDGDIPEDLSENLSWLDARAAELRERWHADEAYRDQRLKNRPTKVELMLEVERLTTQLMVMAEDEVLVSLAKAAPKPH